MEKLEKEEESEESCGCRARNKGLRGKAGRCLNIEHMSPSPLRHANENRSHHRTSSRWMSGSTRRGPLDLDALLFCGLVFAVTRPCFHV